MLKVAVTNAVLSNSGDAAIYEAILASLDSAGIASPNEVIVFDANARVTSKIYPHWNVYQQLTVSPPREIARVRAQLQRIRLLLVGLLATRNRLTQLLRVAPFNRSRFAKSYQALMECDLVISSGGTYLVDHYDFGPRVVELNLAKGNNSVIVLWTQSLGPFKTRLARERIEKIAAVTDAVYFRDERSAAAWSRVTTQPALQHVAPDSVFGLSDNSSSPHRVAGDSTHLKAFISVREWSRGVDSDKLASGRYEMMLRAGASKLIQDGWKVECLSTCQGVPSYAFDDSKIARQIFRGIPVDINANFHTPQELLGELATADLVVTTRMHLAILSLVARKPVIAIAYEFKTLELFNAIGLGEFVVRIEDANDEWLSSRIALLQTNPMKAVLSEEQLRVLKELALAPAQELKEELPHLIEAANAA